MDARGTWAGAVVGLFILGGCASPRGAQVAPPEPVVVAPVVAVPQTDEEKTLYALGLTLGRQLRVFDLSPRELAFVREGLTAQVLGEPPAVDPQRYGAGVQDLAQERVAARTVKERGRAQATLDAAAREPGAVRLESGLVYRDLTVGTGASPSLTDVVTVSYRGLLPDGKEFDNSSRRETPTRFTPSSVITCWTEGLQRMKVGGRAKLVCPAALAYGDRGTPGIPGGAVLTFEMELLDVQAQ